MARPDSYECPYRTPTGNVQFRCPPRQLNMQFSLSAQVRPPEQFTTNNTATLNRTRGLSLVSADACQAVYPLPQRQTSNGMCDRLSPR